MSAPHVTDTKAIRVAYGEALAAKGNTRPDLVVLDADLAHATATYLFGEKYPDRFFNMGIAEQNMMGVAAGLAISGLTVVASTFSIFGTGRAYEQVRNTICYPGLNVTLALTHGGLTAGEDGGSHQSFEDIALMRGIPGMTILVPCDANEMGRVLDAALDHKAPVYIRVARPPAPVFTDPSAPFTIGCATRMRDGRDISLIATGLMVYQALMAAEELSGEGIEASVINMHTIKPIDRATVLDEARKTGRLMTIEEHSVVGGLGTAVSEVLSDGLPTPLRRLGLQDSFGQSGTPDGLLDHYGLTAPHIASAARKMITEMAGRE